MKLAAILSGLLLMGAVASGQAPNTHRDGPAWESLAPGLKVQRGSDGVHNYVHYHAFTAAASDQLSMFLLANGLNEPPRMALKSGFKNVGYNDCTSVMGGGEYARTASGSVRVNCPSGTGIQATIELMPAVGSGIQSGSKNFFGTSSLSGTYQGSCAIDPTSGGCQRGVVGEDLNNWEIDISWSADNGESDYKRICGDTNYGCVPN